MKTELDLNKPVHSLTGTPFTLLSASGRGEFSIIGYLGDDPTIRTWRPDGCYTHTPSDIDLLNVPEKDGPRALTSSGSTSRQKEYWSRPEHVPPVCFFKAHPHAPWRPLAFVDANGLGVSGDDFYHWERVSDIRWSERPGVQWEDMKNCIVEEGGEDE